MISTFATPAFKLVGDWACVGTLCRSESVAKARIAIEVREVLAGWIGRGFMVV